MLPIVNSFTCKHRITRRRLVKQLWRPHSHEDVYSKATQLHIVPETNTTTARWHLCSNVWRGFPTAADCQHLESLLKRGRRGTFFTWYTYICSIITIHSRTHCWTSS